MKNQTYYTKIYNASYSFTNETGLIDTDIPFITFETMENEINIINDSNHNEILNTTGTAWLKIRNDFKTFQENGTIELWIKLYETNAHHRLMIDDRGVEIRFSSTGQVMVYNGIEGWIQVGSLTYSADTWYHLRFDFECNINNYKGLSNDTFYLYFNTIKYGAFDFHIPKDNATFFSVDGGGGGNMGFCLDAIGYNWLDNYTIGDNIIPLQEINNTALEVNRDEFNFEGLNDLYDDFDDDPLDWLDIETGCGDAVNIITTIPAPSKPSFDRIVGMFPYDDAIQGLKRENFNLESIFINISLSERYQFYDGYHNITIISYDNSMVIELKINDDGIFYYNGATYTMLVDETTENVYYKYDLFIHYQLNRCFLKINNGTLYTFDFPLLEVNKKGLKAIYLKSITEYGEAMTTYLDYVGVYGNGISQATDLGFGCMSNNLNKTFNSRKHYLFNIKSVGYFAVLISETNGIDYPTSNYGNNYIITDFNVHNNESYFENIYTLSDNIFENACMSIYLNNSYYNNNFNISFLEIEGFSLIESVNEYLPKIYIDSTLDKNVSYFYVDNYNRLNYIHNATIGIDYEYLWVWFDIPSMSSNNRSISFYGWTNSTTPTTFTIACSDYDDNIILLKPTYKYYHYLLKQEKIINGISIAITSYTENWTSVGFITSFSLKYLPTYTDLTITTLSLLLVIIPLIIILVPSLGFWRKFGKIGFILMFLLMSLICVITNLIPVWLFFLIAFGMSIFIIKEMSKKREI